MNANLSQSIENLYSTFHGWRPPNLAVCTDCCMDPSLEAQIIRENVRDLSVESVQEWNGAAFAAGLETARPAVKHFLPRSAEILADGQLPHPFDSALSFHRLRLTGFPNDWDKGEVEAVNQYFRALNDAVLEHSGFFHQIHLADLHCMAGQANVTATPLLSAAEKASDKTLARAISFVVACGDWDPDKNHLFSGFWNDVSEPIRSEVFGWWQKPEWKTLMEAAFHLEGDPIWAERISQAELMLQASQF